MDAPGRMRTVEKRQDLERGVKPALQNTWGGIRISDSPSSGTEGSTHLVGGIMASEKSEPKPSDLDQGMARFCKGPKSKYLRLCRPHGFCCSSVVDSMLMTGHGYGLIKLY